MSETIKWADSNAMDGGSETNKTTDWDELTKLGDVAPWIDPKTDNLAPKKYSEAPAEAQVWADPNTGKLPDNKADESKNGPAPEDAVWADVDAAA